MVFLFQRNKIKMKKLLLVLGLSMTLVGCGENAKQPVKVDSNAEKSAVVSDVKETEKNTKDVKETEKVANDVKEVEKVENDVKETENAVNNVKDTADKTTNPEDKSAVKSNEVLDDKVQTNVEKRSLKPVKQQSQVQQKQTQKSVQRNVSQDEGIGKDGLSAEERRVGAQSIQESVSEKANKIECSYPNLSAEERRVSNCN